MKTNVVLDAIKARRSVRRFADIPIVKDDLLTILEAGTYAPNGMHYETWHFTAILNKEKLVELNNVIKSGLGRTTNSHFIELSKSESYNCSYHAPVFVIVSNVSDKNWASQDCACAMENMFLAAHSLGLGSCWINQLCPICDDLAVRDYITQLGVPANHKVYGCVALGYPSPSLVLKEKKVKEGNITLVE